MKKEIKKGWKKPSIKEIKIDDGSNLITACAKTIYYDGSPDETPNLYCSRDQAEIFS